MKMRIVTTTQVREKESILAQTEARQKVSLKPSNLTAVSVSPKNEQDKKLVYSGNFSGLHEHLNRQGVPTVSSSPTLKDVQLNKKHPQKRK